MTAKSTRRAEAQRQSLPWWVTEERVVLLWLATLALVVLAVFVPTLSSKFVYDSTAEIITWDYLHEPGNILTPLTFQLMRMDVIDFNRPIAVAYLMFNAMLWGKEPFGFHLDSILLHIATTCLVFLLIRHFLSKRDGVRALWQNLTAFLATLFFALHPVMTEAVCEPSYCKDLLAALFGLGALILALRHRPGFGDGDVLRLFLIPLLCLLSIGSKEVGVAIPALLFLYVILFRRGEPGNFWSVTLSASVLVVALFLVARFALEHRPSEVFVHPPSYPDGSLGAAMLIEPRILVLYLNNIVWPLHPCADYNGYSTRNIWLLPSLVILAIVVGLAGWWSTKDRRAFFAFGFIALALLPVSNLVPIYHPVADRYLYLPMIGVALLLALGANQAWAAATSFRQAVTLSLLVALIGLLIPVTLNRQSVWSNELTLWQSTLATNPASFAARVNLPEALMLAGRLDEARRESEVTLSTEYASSPVPWFDYALELNRLGDHDGARQAARKALALEPDLADGDKMIRTLQLPKNLAMEFAQLAATLSNEKRQ